MLTIFSGISITEEVVGSQFHLETDLAVELKGSIVLNNVWLLPVSTKRIYLP